MSRIRRIEERDRIFFVTANLAASTPSLSAQERDFVLYQLGEVREALRFLLLGYVIMPDHADLVLRSIDQPLPDIMHQWKFKTGFALQKQRAAKGAFWQARYFDFICRRSADVANKLRYLHENPVAAALVARPEDWPWSSAGYYSGTKQPVLIPDHLDFSGDSDQLLWPAPWRRV